MFVCFNLWSTNSGFLEAMIIVIEFSSLALSYSTISNIVTKNPIKKLSDHTWKIKQNLSGAINLQRFEENFYQ